MKKQLKMITLTLLVILLLVETMWIGASAYSKCGDNVYWSFDKTTGELFIDGTGPMYDDYGCYFTFVDGIKSVIINDGVTSIGCQAFYQCESLEKVTIPDSVITIGDGAFYDCISLEEIIMPNSIITIGDIAFMGCTNLESVTVSDNITEIGYGAFWGCTSLNDIIIPEGVLTIGNCAFRGCSRLEKITLPDSVTKIDYLAFSECDKLKSIDVDKDNLYYASENGVLFNKDKTELIQYPIGNMMSAYIIPDSVTKICYRAFWGGKNLESITIPDSITIIEEGAFEECTSLVCVLIPCSVTSIGEYTFQFCESLQYIYVDTNNLFYSNDEYGVLFNKDKTELIQYPMGNMRMTYTFPKGVKKVGDMAFRDCKGLQSVLFCDNVTDIGHYAFNGCSYLTGITIFDDVTNMGGFAFNNTAYYNNTCNWKNDSLYIGDYLIAVKTDIADIKIKSSVKTIGNYVFQDCKNLKNVYYMGSQEEWNKINVGVGNSFKEIIFHFNYRCLHSKEKIIAIVNATCTTDGYTEGIYCSECETWIEGHETISKTGHDFVNGICQNCGEMELEDCFCICHESGFSGFIYKIFRFFWKLFKINPVCSCGVAHY